MTLVEQDVHLKIAEELRFLYLEECGTIKTSNKKKDILLLSCKSEFLVINICIH